MTSVAIVIPAYNAGPDFGAKLVSFADYFTPLRAYDLTYVIVDDCSTDDTLRFARAFARYRSNVAVLAHTRTCGLGQALRTAFAAVSAEYTVVVDRTLTYAPAAAMDLLESLDASGADLAIASSCVPGSYPPQTRLIDRAAAAFVNRTFSLLTGGRYVGFTAVLRAYRTSFLKRLIFKAAGTGALAELLMAAIRARGRIIERPLRGDWLLPGIGAFAAAAGR